MILKLYLALETVPLLSARAWFVEVKGKSKSNGVRIVLGAGKPGEK